MFLPQETTPTITDCERARGTDTAHAIPIGITVVMITFTVEADNHVVTS